MIADGILFDLDGTLWDSIDGILLTWNRVITRHGQLRPPITRQEQEGLMGLPMDEIARRLFTEQSAEAQKALMDECAEEENAYLAIHGGVLFKGVAETLKQLGQTHKLCIVSNCQKGYIEAFLKAHKLEKLFTDHLSFGETGLTKGENNRIVVQRNGFRSPVYVGDTQSDRQSALDAGIPFVFCRYGFGSVDEYDEVISEFPELLRVFASSEKE